MEPELEVHKNTEWQEQISPKSMPDWLIDWLTILFQFGNTPSTITIFGGRAIYTSFMHHSYI